MGIDQEVNERCQELKAVKNKMRGCVTPELSPTLDANLPN